jgi:hypothetical protein
VCCSTYCSLGPSCQGVRRPTIEGKVLKLVKVTSSGERAAELVRDPDGYFVKLRAEAQRVAKKPRQVRRTRVFSRRS